MNRTSSDDEIKAKLTTESEERTTSDDTLKDSIVEETNSRIKADSNLQSSITAVNERVDTLVGELTTEEETRQNADVSLQSNIDAEIVNRQTADNTLQTNIDAESTTRQSADTFLQTSINTETEAREKADAAKAEKVHSHVVADISDYEPYDDTEVRGLISAESTARTGADAKKVGYQEVQGNTLYMYSDNSKATLLATLELPKAPVQDVQLAGNSIVADGVADLSSIQQDYVDGILCSSDETQALTTQQKIDARNRIDAVGNSWELIESIELTADTAGDPIAKTSFPDGTPYELSECFVQITYPKGIDSSGAKGFGRINFYNENEAILRSLPSMCEASTSLSTDVYVYVHAKGGNLGLCRYTKAGKLGSTNNWNIYSGYGAVANFGNITAIKGFTGEIFPKGTIIDIYGIRA